MSENLIRTDTGRLSTLTLNRPEKRNAITGALADALRAEAEDIAAQGSRIECVVIRGAGKSFCAGVDLGALARNEPVGVAGAAAVKAVAALPQPVIVAVQGHCMTGGLELALAGDLIVAEPGTLFADTHSRWGLVASWGMAQRLRRKVGASRAKLMTWTARTFTAQEAFAIGLVDVVAEKGRLDEMIDALTADVLANSAHVNFETKRVHEATDGMSLVDGLAFEQATHPGHAPDRNERIARFKAKPQ